MTFKVSFWMFLSTLYLLEGTYVINTASCRYEFVINEMDNSKCPNVQNTISETNQVDATDSRANIPLPPPPPRDEALMHEITELQEKLFDEIVSNRVINTTVSKHESMLKTAERILTFQQLNLTRMQALLYRFERHLLVQREYAKNIDHKLSGVMINIAEVNNVIEKRLSSMKPNDLEKDMPVKAASRMQTCAISDEKAVHKDCLEVLRKGHTSSGVYYIRPIYAACPIPVWCDMDTTPGGWLAIQRRNNGRQNFNQNWLTYRQGFGDVTKEFWLGNENLFLITNQDKYRLRIDLWDFFGSRVYAEYKVFKLDGERDFYKLHVANHTGTAPDGFGKHDGLYFSANDTDHDNWTDYHCAREWESGWWFNNCWYVILNGRYQNETDAKYKGIAWNDWKIEQLKGVEMKIRPDEDDEDDEDDST